MYFTGGLYLKCSKTILDVAFAIQIKIIYFQITVVFGCGFSASAGNLLKVFSHVGNLLRG